ncbi:hypothetical protein NSERUTF1_5197 [Nocardia seriolae]|nr:hypothetical protein NSERUTF1_5197 [Nocardia seriolae]
MTGGHLGLHGPQCRSRPRFPLPPSHRRIDHPPDPPDSPRKRRISLHHSRTGRPRDPRTPPQHL